MLHAASQAGTKKRIGFRQAIGYLSRMHFGTMRENARPRRLDIPADLAPGDLAVVVSSQASESPNSPSRRHPGSVQRNTGCVLDNWLAKLLN